MKKKVLALLTAGMLLVSGTVVHGNADNVVHGSTYTEKQQRIADALYHVDLFRGTNLGYELDRELNRVEGITLLVRMLGQEDAAMSKTYTLPFTDVDDWAKPYVGYAYENGITNGISATEFGSKNTMTDYMFITLTLRALGYTDKGEAPQFVWNEPYVLANSTGLIGSADADTFFTRGDAVEVFWNALSRDEYTLAYSLRDRGVFTADELEDAINIYLYGKTEDEDDSSSVVESSDPSEDFDWEDWEDWVEDWGDTSDKDDKPSDSDKDESVGEGDQDNPSGSNPETPSEPDTNPETPANPETPSEPDTPETPTVPFEPSGEVTYEMYLAMSGEEQQAYFLTYENPADFFAWLNAGKAEYEAQNPSIEIGGDSSIDLGDLIG